VRVAEVAGEGVVETGGQDAGVRSSGLREPEDVPVPVNVDVDAAATTGADTSNGPAEPTSPAAEVGVTEPREVTPQAGAGESASNARHRVAAGDNLWTLARRYGVTVADLERWNGLGGGGTLRVGQELHLGPGLRTHTVVRGDTWGGLARRFGTTPGELARVNGRAPNQVIRVGERLRIP
jgi:LysM repeat protein